MTSDDIIFFLIAAKRIMTLPSVPEERERHHSVAAMTNIQGRKQVAKKKMSTWTRRSTRWTLIADNVKVFLFLSSICQLITDSELTVSKEITSRSRVN